MSQKKIGVGIIGIQPNRSWAAVAHIPALRALAADYEIVAVSTTRQESADNAAEIYGIPHAFDSAEKLVNCEGVDLVAVTVKVPQHFELVTQAIKAGKHVYCEWPLGNGIEEAREMAALAKQHNVVAVCGMQARFSPELSYLRDLLAEGYVGEVLSASIIGSGLIWGPFTEQANAYTADIKNGATMLAIPVGHTMDAVCLALGEFAQLQATLANRRTTAVVMETQETIEMTAHDQVIINGTLTSGAPVSVHYRGGIPRGTGLLIEINGSQGDIQISGFGGHAQLMDLEIKGATGEDQALVKLDVPEKYQVVPVEGARAGNVARFYKKLAEDIREGTSACPTFEDAVRRHQMLEAIAASAQSGCIEKPEKY